MSHTPSACIHSMRIFNQKETQFAKPLTKRFSHSQTLSMSQILFTVRENYAENPNIKEIRNQV